MSLDNGSNFTVVTPNFNMGEYLAETIESVLFNLRPGDEYFIIDGGSTDESVEIIRRYEHRITGWVSEKDRGYADALAKGFERANGEYQCWVNCGDLLLPGALDKARELLSANKIDFSYGDAIDLDENGNVLWISSAKFQPLYKYMLYGGWTPWQVSCFWKKSLYERCGGINPGISLAADYDLFLRMAKNARVNYSPIFFGAHRHHEGQLSMSQQINYKAEKNLIRLSEKVFETGIFDVLERVFYWIATRVKSRFFGHSSASCNWVNKHYSEVKSVA